MKNFLGHFRFSILDVRRTIAVCLVAAMILTTPGTTGWATITNPTNSNSNLNPGTNLPQDATTGNLPPNLSQKTIDPNTISNSPTGVNAVLSDIRGIENIAAFGSDEQQLANNASAAEKLPLADALYGSGVHDVQSTVATINGNPVSAADLAAGGQYAFGYDWNAVSASLMKESGQLLSDPSGLINFLQNNDMGDINAYINEVLQNKVDAANQAQADAFDSQQGDNLQSLCDNLNCNPLPFAKGSGVHVSVEAVQEQMNRLAQELQNNIEYANTLKVSLQILKNSLNQELNIKYGDLNFGLTKFIANLKGNGYGVGPQHQPGIAELTNDIASLTQKINSDPDPSKDQAQITAWNNQIKIDKHGIDIIQCELNSGSAVCQQATQQASQSSFSFSSPLTVSFKAPSVQSGISNQSKGLIAIQNDLTNKYRTAKANFDAIDNNFLIPLKQYFSGLVGPINPDLMALQSKVNYAMGRAYDPTYNQPYGQYTPDHPPPQPRTVSYAQALLLEKGKTPPPPVPKSDLSAIARELQNMSSQVGVTGLGKGITIPTNILTDANAYTNAYAAATPYRLMDNKLTALRDQKEQILEDNFNQVIMKPFRDMGIDSAYEHAQNIISVHAQASALKEQLQARVDQLNNLADKVANGQMDSKTAIAMLLCSPSQVASGACNVGSNIVISNTNLISTQLIQGPDGKSYFNPSYIPSQFDSLAFNAYGTAFVEGGIVPLQQYGEYQNFGSMDYARGFSFAAPWTLDPSVYSQSFFSQFDPSVSGSLAQSINAMQPWYAAQEARQLETANLAPLQAQITQYNQALVDLQKVVPASLLGPYLPPPTLDSINPETIAAPAAPSQLASSSNGNAPAKSIGGFGGTPFALITINPDAFLPSDTPDSPADQAKWVATYGTDEGPGGHLGGMSDRFAMDVIMAPGGLNPSNLLNWMSGEGIMSPQTATITMQGLNSVGTFVGEHFNAIGAVLTGIPITMPIGLSMMTISVMSTSNENFQQGGQQPDGSFSYWNGFKSAVVGTAPMAIADGITAVTMGTSAAIADGAIEAGGLVTFLRSSPVLAPIVDTVGGWVTSAGNWVGSFIGATANSASILATGTALTPEIIAGAGTAGRILVSGGAYLGAAVAPAIPYSVAAYTLATPSDGFTAKGVMGAITYPFQAAVGAGEWVAGGLSTIITNPIAGAINGAFGTSLPLNVGAAIQADGIGRMFGTDVPAAFGINPQNVADPVVLAASITQGSQALVGSDGKLYFAADANLPTLPAGAVAVCDVKTGDTIVTLPAGMTLGQLAAASGNEIQITTNGKGVQVINFSEATTSYLRPGAGSQNGIVSQIQNYATATHNPILYAAALVMNANLVTGDVSGFGAVGRLVNGVVSSASAGNLGMAGIGEVLSGVVQNVPIIQFNGTLISSLAAARASGDYSNFTFELGSMALGVAGAHGVEVSGTEFAQSVVSESVKMGTVAGIGAALPFGPNGEPGVWQTATAVTGAYAPIPIGAVTGVYQANAADRAFVLQAVQPSTDSGVASTPTNPAELYGAMARMAQSGTATNLEILNRLAAGVDPNIEIPVPLNAPRAVPDSIQQMAALAVLNNAANGSGGVSTTDLVTLAAGNSVTLKNGITISGEDIPGTIADDMLASRIRQTTGSETIQQLVETPSQSVVSINGASIPITDSLRAALAQDFVAENRSNASVLGNLLINSDPAVREPVANAILESRASIDSSVLDQAREVIGDSVSSAISETDVSGKSLKTFTTPDGVTYKIVDKFNDGYTVQRLIKGDADPAKERWSAPQPMDAASVRTSLEMNALAGRATEAQQAGLERLADNLNYIAAQKAADFQASQLKLAQDGQAASDSVASRIQVARSQLKADQAALVALQAQMKVDSSVTQKLIAQALTRVASAKAALADNALSVRTITDRNTVTTTLSSGRLNSGNSDTQVVRLSLSPNIPGVSVLSKQALEEGVRAGLMGPTAITGEFGKELAGRIGLGGFGSLDPRGPAFDNPSSRFANAARQVLTDAGLLIEPPAPSEAGRPEIQDSKSGNGTFRSTSVEVKGPDENGNGSVRIRASTNVNNPDPSTVEGMIKLSPITFNTEEARAAVDSALVDLNMDPSASPDVIRGQARAFEAEVDYFTAAARNSESGVADALAKLGRAQEDLFLAQTVDESQSAVNSIDRLVNDLKKQGVNENDPRLKSLLDQKALAEQRINLAREYQDALNVKDTDQREAKLADIKSRMDASDAAAAEAAKGAVDDVRNAVVSLIKEELSKPGMDDRIQSGLDNLLKDAERAKVLEQNPKWQEDLTQRQNVINEIANAFEKRWLESGQQKATERILEGKSFGANVSTGVGKTIIAQNAISARVVKQGFADADVVTKGKDETGKYINDDFLNLLKMKQEDVFNYIGQKTNALLGVRVIDMDPIAEAMRSSHSTEAVKKFVQAMDDPTLVRHWTTEGLGHLRTYLLDPTASAEAREAMSRAMNRIQRIILGDEGDLLLRDRWEFVSSNGAKPITLEEAALYEQRFQAVQKLINYDPATREVRGGVLGGIERLEGDVNEFNRRSALGEAVYHVDPDGTVDGVSPAAAKLFDDAGVPQSLTGSGERILEMIEAVRLGKFGIATNGEKNVFAPKSSSSNEYQPDQILHDTEASYAGARALGESEVGAAEVVMKSQTNRSSGGGQFFKGKSQIVILSGSLGDLIVSARSMGVEVEQFGDVKNVYIGDSKAGSDIKLVQTTIGEKGDIATKQEMASRMVQDAVQAFKETGRIQLLFSKDPTVNALIVQDLNRMLDSDPELRAKAMAAAEDAFAKAQAKQIEGIKSAEDLMVVNFDASSDNLGRILAKNYSVFLAGDGRAIRAVDYSYKFVDERLDNTYLSSSEKQQAWGRVGRFEGQDYTRTEYGMKIKAEEVLQSAYALNIREALLKAGVAQYGGNEKPFIDANGRKIDPFKMDVKGMEKVTNGLGLLRQYENLDQAMRAPAPEQARLAAWVLEMVRSSGGLEGNTSGFIKDEYLDRPLQDWIVKYKGTGLDAVITETFSKLKNNEFTAPKAKALLTDVVTGRERMADALKTEQQQSIRALSDLQTRLESTQRPADVDEQVWNNARKELLETVKSQLAEWQNLEFGATPPEVMKGQALPQATSLQHMVWAALDAGETLAPKVSGPLSTPHAIILVDAIQQARETMIQRPLTDSELMHLGDLAARVIANDPAAGKVEEWALLAGSPNAQAVQKFLGQNEMYTLNTPNVRPVQAAEYTNPSNQAGNSSLGAKPIPLISGLPVRSPAPLSAIEQRFQDFSKYFSFYRQQATGASGIPTFVNAVRYGASGAFGNFGATKATRINSAIQAYKVATSPLTRKLALQNLKQWGILNPNIILSSPDLTQQAIAQIALAAAQKEKTSIAALALQKKMTQDLENVKTIALNSPRLKLESGNGFVVAKRTVNGKTVYDFFVDPKSTGKVTSEALLKAVSLNDFSGASQIEVNIQLPAETKENADRLQAIRDMAKEANQKGANIFVAEAGEVARRIPPKHAANNTIDLSANAHAIPGLGMRTLRLPVAKLRQTYDEKTGPIFKLEKAVKGLESLQDLETSAQSIKDDTPAQVKSYVEDLLKKQQAHVDDELSRLRTTAAQLARVEKFLHLPGTVRTLIQDLAKAQDNTAARAAIEKYQQAVGDEHVNTVNPMGLVPQHAKAAAAKIVTPVQIMNQFLHNKLSKVHGAAFLLKGLTPEKVKAAATPEAYQNLLKSIAEAEKGRLAKQHTRHRDQKAITRVTKVYAEATDILTGMNSQETGLKTAIGDQIQGLITADANAPIIVVMPDGVNDRIFMALKAAFPQVQMITTQVYADYLKQKAAAIKASRQIAIDRVPPLLKSRPALANKSQLLKIGASAAAVAMAGGLLSGGLGTVLMVGASLPMLLPMLKQASQGKSGLAALASNKQKGNFALSPLQQIGLAAGLLTAGLALASVVAAAPLTLLLSWKIAFPLISGLTAGGQILDFTFGALRYRRTHSSNSAGVALTPVTPATSIESMLPSGQPHSQHTEQMVKVAGIGGIAVGISAYLSQIGAFEGLGSGVLSFLSFNQMGIMTLSPVTLIITGVAGVAAWLLYGKDHVRATTIDQATRLKQILVEA